jgi:hypothetical protein
LSFRYIDELMVVMRTGGLSNANLRQRWVLNREAVEVCRANGVETSWWRVLRKLLGKVPGFFSIGEGVDDCKRDYNYSLGEVVLEKESR